MAVNLLVLPYGETLAVGNVDNMKVRIATEFDAEGKITSAQLIATYDLDFSQIIPVDETVSARYKMDRNQIGYSPNTDIYLASGDDDASVILSGDSTFLNVKFPLKEPKKDYGDLMLT